MQGNNKMNLVSCDNFPIINITQENCSEKWILLRTSIESSSFISLDIVKTMKSNNKIVLIKLFIPDLWNNFIGVFILKIHRDSPKLHFSVFINSFII
jgi:hypothetical protein